MNSICCPQCSGEIIYQEKETMLHCEFCQSSLLLQSVIDNQTIQFPLNTKIIINESVYQTFSRVQWLHDFGIRTEYLLHNNKGSEFILSKDDEDVSLVQRINLKPLMSNKPLDWTSLEPNTLIDINGESWLVTEKRKMSSYAKQNFYFSYLTGQNAEILVLIFKGLSQNSLVEIRKGTWLDVFDIQYMNQL